MDPKLRQIYNNSPSFVQNAAVSLKGWQIVRRRYGANYDEIVENYLERQQYSESELREYQRQRMGSFLESAGNSPFWKKRFSEYGVDTETDDPLTEVSKLPILTKEDVKSHKEEIVPNDIPEGDLLPCHTSGTTGSGLQFYRTRDALQEQFATWWRYWNWHGLSRKTWNGYFGGTPIVPLTQSKPPYWRVNRPDRSVMFSIQHITEKTASDYVDEICRRKLPWVHGFPSSISLLGGIMLEQGIPAPDSVNIVTTGAQTLYDYQRDIIEAAFDAQVREHYGLEEAVANISECPHGNYHVDEDFSFVEFVPFEDDSDLYRIIGTNWTNPAFPLFRYDTGDLASLADDCDCGRPGRIVESLSGRRDDYVVLPNGAKVTALSHIFKDVTEIKGAQIYQEEVESITIRVIPGEGYSEETTSHIREMAQSRLGSELEINIEHLDELERTESEKRKLVISDIDEMQISPGINEKSDQR